MDDEILKESVNGVCESYGSIGSDEVYTQPVGDDVSYWTNLISYLKEEHKEELHRVKALHEETIAHTIISSRTDYEKELKMRLAAQESIHESVITFIQDELDSERGNHALIIQAHHESQERLNATVGELQSRLSLFEQIDAAK